MKKKLKDFDWWVQEHIYKYRVPTPKLFWIAIFITLFVETLLIDIEGPFFSWRNLLVIAICLIFWFATTSFLTLTWGRTILSREEYEKWNWKHMLGIKK